MNSANATFSVVINTTDRASSLRTLLYALAHQSYREYEVIVVVGPTRDNTLEVLEEFDGRVQILRCPTANLSRSRNIGLEAARGEVVAFIDDDAVPCRNWLSQLATLFQDPLIDASGGVVYLIHPEQPAIQHRIGVVSALAEQHDVLSSPLGQLAPDGVARLWTGRMMGTNMAFRRAALLEVRGFDEFYEWVYDDTDLAVRMVNAGKVVHPVMETAVYHVPASSRNRVAYTYLGRWWIQTKASIYFCIKNGRSSGEPWSSIVRRSLYQAHGHWLWAGQLWREGKISFAQMAQMRWQESKSALHGALAGLLTERRLLSSQEAGSDDEEMKPIRPFQTPDSSMTPAVDPVSGRVPQVSMPDTPMRICLLSHAYPPEQYEGVGRHTNLMARGLHELGHTVHVVSHGQREQITYYEGAYVHRTPYRLSRYARYRHLPRLQHQLNYSHAVHDKIKRMMLNDDIQIVDSPVWQTDGLITALADLLPVVVRPQTAVRQIGALQREQDDDTRLIGDMEQLLIDRAAYLVPNSCATLRTLQEVYGVDPELATYAVVPHGIEPCPEEYVRPYDLAAPHDTPTVLYVGRLEQRKGILDLFAAIPLVLEQIPNARFVITGQDNSHSDLFLQRTGLDYPTHFKRQHPELLERVEFLGRVDEEMLQSLYQECDLFVAPSLYESFGLIYLEAMNYAKPVIGCTAGGVPEVVDDGVSGLLVEPGAGRELAEAINSLLGSPKKLYEMGVAGRRQLLDKFTHLQMARGFEKIYRQTISASEG